jgi:hypothetical protein
MAAIDFPASPTVGQIFTSGSASWEWDGARWIAFSSSTDAPSDGTLYGRENGAWVNALPLAGGTLTGPLVLNANPTAALGAAPKQYVDAQNVHYRSRIINGDMSLDQRHNGAQTAMSGSMYAIDRWRFGSNLAGTYGNAGQSIAANASAGLFAYLLQWNGTAAYAVTAADSLTFYQGIEGSQFNDAWFGTTSAQSLMLEFWAAANTLGTYGGSLRNGVGTRSYPFTYTLAAANVWQKFRIAIPGDTAGAWSVVANAIAAILTFSLGAGATFSGPAGAWASANYVSATGALSSVASATGQLSITGVAIMVGAAAANAEPEFKKFSDNLLDCQRYYRKLGGSTGADIYVVGYASAASQPAGCSMSLTPSMRAAPTASFANPVGWAQPNATAAALYAGPTSLGIQIQAIGAGITSFYTVDTTTFITLDADF